MRTMLALLLAAASLATPAARAQGPACTKDLQNFLGLPVTSAALAAVGTVMAGYFSPRTRDGRTTTVNPDDLRQLGRIYKDAGIDDCEMRREFRAMASSGVPGGGGIPAPIPARSGQAAFRTGRVRIPTDRVAASPRARSAAARVVPPTASRARSRPWRWPWTAASRAAAIRAVARRGRS
jgi:hypothetical protein